MRKVLFTVILFIGIFLFGYSALGSLSSSTFFAGIFNTSSNSTIYVDIIDESSTSYGLGKRIDIIQNYDPGSNSIQTYSNMGTGIIISEQYGDFYIKNNLLELINDNPINSNCADVSYSFTGTFISPSFGELKVQNGSYFCPTSGDNNINLHSELLGNISLSGSVIKNMTTSIINSRGEAIDISTANILDNKKISVTGLTNLTDTTGLDSVYTENTNIDIDFQIEGKMANFNKTIDINLSKQTRNLTPTINNDFVLDGFSKKIHYYNFEGQEEISASNINNKGKILKIGNYNLTDSNENYYRMGVAGQKLIYVKGGNIYIDADIYNNSQLSQLVIIVKRDSTNRKNGGNIYINPEVTNIDATIIADGSIISYNGTNILNTDTRSDLLKKQLLIYGSISTKNTFGEDKAIYGTDSYIDNGGEEVTGTGLYNLAKLRSLRSTLNDFIIGDCAGTNQIVARGDTSSGALKYAFAGKKECYLSQPSINGLRGTEKLTPLVIEYNPIIQINPHFILESN